MEKKGSAHLEMILAFTIFLVAVVFLLVYIRPLETTKISDVAVISLKNEFVENTETLLVTLFANGSERCIPAENISEDLRSLNSTYHSITDTTFYLLFSDDFDTNVNHCTEEEIVGVGNPFRKNVLSNKSIHKIQEKYYSNYSGLREDLRVPRAMNFEIETGDGTISMIREGSAEIDFDIIAKRYTFSVLISNGTLINKEFVFKIW
jgi:hypothetical protein